MYNQKANLLRAEGKIDLCINIFQVA